MRDYLNKYLIYLIIFSLSFFAFSCKSSETTITDPKFEEKIKSAHEEVDRYLEQKAQGKAEDKKDPRKKIAEEFYQYFLKNEGTKTGKTALTNAVQMWVSIDELTKVEQVISALPATYNISWPFIWHLVLIVVMVIAGISGGIINFYLEDEKGDNKADPKQRKKRSIAIGLGAAFLVPLFLEIIQSDLISIDKFNKGSILVFGGFCLVASMSARRFITAISNQVLKDMQKDVKDAKDRVKEVEEQVTVDAKVLSALEKALEAKPALDQPSIAPEALKKIISEASMNIKITAFLRTRAFRRTHKNLNKENKQSIISIFEGLIEADEKKAYHRNYAELGFVLKRDPEPQYDSAIEVLSKAIEIRDNLGHSGFLAYEFNRAVCKIDKIGRDPNFKSGKPTPEATRGPILADLKKASQQKFWKGVVQGKKNKEQNKSLSDWLKLNPL